MRQRTIVNGILVVYNHPPFADAPTIMEHVNAFPRHSRFKVWTVNTDLGFPPRLDSFDFSVVVVHYSLFGVLPFVLSDRFERYVRASSAYRVAFFQDENHYCRPRFDFVNRNGIDCIYTLVEPRYWDALYRRHTSASKLVHTLTGFVSDDLVERAAALTRPDEQRTIDVGYRARTLPFYMGRGAREKSEIGRRFLERARESGLKLDIAVDEGSRIYGDAWFEFLAECRAVLGTEAGVSIFDVDDVVAPKAERLLALNPDLTFEELSSLLLEQYEDRIFYRTISPRHFEAAALRVCQILFAGQYSGILEPMEHYIPLEKDFSNFDEVLRRFRDPDVRRRLTESVYRDLIASRKYSYERFIESFDEELLSAGLEPTCDESVASRVTSDLRRDEKRLRHAARLSAAIHGPFPGRRLVAPVVKPVYFRVRETYTAWKRRRLDAKR